MKEADMATERRREPTTHRLKSWPESFRAILAGRKRFEIRRDDRNFQPGDIVELLQWDPVPDDDETPRGFTGERAMFFVGYVERSPAIPAGWCGFELITAREINRVALAMSSGVVL
jgi:Domain of unknown function (DUF3850)